MAYNITRTTLTIYDFNVAHQDLIDSATSYFISVVILQQIVKVIARLVGIISNILTLIVFSKAGLQDGISVCFFALTISDLFYLLMFLAATAFGYLDLNFKIKPYISLYWISFVCPFYAVMFYNISTVITIFLSLQKCCCVVMPFRFRGQFSRSRSIFIITFIYIGTSITLLPFTVSVFPFTESFDYSTNSTRLEISFSDIFLANILPVLKALNFISFSVVGEIVVLTCTVLMTVKLREAVAFKMSVAGGDAFSFSVTTSTTEQRVKTTVTLKSTSVITTDRGTRTTAKTIPDQSKINLSKKEFRAAQAVNLVAFIFVVCNTPDVVVFMVSLILPDFSGDGNLVNSYRLCIELQELLKVVNMSVNIFVYLNFNSKFLSIFMSTVLGNLKKK